MADVAKSIVVTGLPSLLMLTLVTVLVEYSIRKKERKELRNFIRAESGFTKYVVQYSEIPKALEDFLTIVSDGGIPKIKILMVGPDTSMIRDISNTVSKIYRTQCKLEILLLDPSSDLADKRGSSIDRPDYQQNIDSNISGLKRWLKKQIELPHSSISEAKIYFYCCDIPPALTIRVDNEFTVFSPLWASESVKEGPFCFVPQNNSMFEMLGKSYEEIERVEHFSVG
ncbi:hypothetical protein HYN79_04000 [Vibrio parahaemolyticus]|nr:hypothetical protein [Vibrio parahaemolyticus]MBM5185700.1 hypothetical protein [Vibrio parahaemolyticus]